MKKIKIITLLSSQHPLRRVILSLTAGLLISIETSKSKAGKEKQGYSVSGISPFFE